MKKIGKIIDNLYKSIKFADRSSNEIQEQKKQAKVAQG
jgi:hypothetical protein